MSGAALTLASNRPELGWVPIANCYIDSNYQRPVKMHLVKRIAASFSWAKFGALVVAKQTSGTFAIVEGQHRWEAAKLMAGVTAVPAVILDATHFGEHDMAFEADVFLAINRDRMAVSTVTQYWAGITAKDPECLRLAGVLAAAGCYIVPEHGADAVGMTHAVSALKRAITAYGGTATITALKTICEAWPKDRFALRGTLITAVAQLARANMTPEFQTTMAEALRDSGYKQLTANAEAFRKLSGGSSGQVIARALVEMHNKGRKNGLIQMGAGK